MSFDVPQGRYRTGDRMTESLALLPQAAATVAVPKASGRPLLLADILQTEQEQRELLKAYIARNMIEGVDYGMIPGTQKNTLLKPGAEKLTDLYRCTAKYTLTNSVEDWDKPLFHYVFRCRVVNRETGEVIAEGFGSANSREGRYRWRNADRACPSCGKNTILRSKFPPRNNPNAEPGWYCYAAKGGCGANFDAKDASIVGQQAGKVENDDIFTMANTILKMAKKRALVDAAIALARCSDIFTQDVEDFGHDPDEPAEPKRPEAKKAEAKRPEPKAKTEPQPKQPEPTTAEPQTDRISPNKQKEIIQLLHAMNKSWTEAKTKDYVSQYLRRPIAVNDHISCLTVDEGNRLVSHFGELLAKKNQRKMEGGK